LHSVVYPVNQSDQFNFVTILRKNLKFLKVGSMVVFLFLIVIYLNI